MNGHGIRRVCHGGVLGAPFDVFGLSGRVRRVLPVYIPQGGFSAYVTLCSSFIRWSVRVKGAIESIQFKQLIALSDPKSTLVWMERKRKESIRGNIADARSYSDVLRSFSDLMLDKPSKHIISRPDSLIRRTHKVPKYKCPIKL